MKDQDSYKSIDEFAAEFGLQQLDGETNEEYVERMDKLAAEAWGDLESLIIGFKNRNLNKE